MSRRRAVLLAGWTVFGLATAGLLLGVVTVVLLATIDLRPLVQRLASDAVGRPVAIGELRIGWGSPLAVELRDLRLANAPAGGDPDLLRVARVSAVIDLWSLLRGVLRFEHLTLDDPMLLLERYADGGVNWRFKDGGAPSWIPLALIPRNRTEFPTLIDFRLRDGGLIYRAAGRPDLRIGFRQLAIRAVDDDQPATLDVDGAYNGTPVRLSGVTGSFAALRDAAVPFDAAIALVTQTGRLDFKGTIAEPVEWDGVAGQLHVTIPKLGDFLSAFGTDSRTAAGLSIEGALAMQGNRWSLTQATGVLARDAFTGTLALVEGASRQPDEVALALAFARLDLNQLVAAGGAPAPSPDIFAYRLDANLAANIDAQIAVKQLVRGKARLADVAVDARVTAGEILVRALSFGLAGGRIEAAGRVQATGAGNHVVADAALSSADVALIAGFAGLDAGEIAGRIDARLRLEMTGTTLAGALKASRGQAVVSMVNGRVARHLVEKAAADLRTLFRKGEGSVPVVCLLGVADVRNGIATIGPLRLRTPDTTVVGGGRADLSSQRLDLTIRGDSESPGTFALQVPLRISGRFDAPDVAPALGAAADPPARPDASPLGPALAQLAARNGCRR